MAGGTRSILSIVSLILLAAGVLFDFFIILSGVVNSTPIDKVYFLQASTNGITGQSNIPNPARWTYFALCGVVGGHNGQCGPIHAAFPFNPPGKKNFDTNQGVPKQFVGTDTYFLLSRFAWVFYLIALFFAVIALFLSLAAIFARLGAYLAGLTTMTALFFQTLAAALMTSWTVLAHKHFNSNNQTAKYGVYGFGFTWAAVVCFFISTLLFCVGGGVSKSSSSGGGSGGKSGGYFGRKKSNKSARSRGSFVDSEDGRRGVKDEYD